MAKRKTATTQATTQVDVVDALVAKLNEIEGVEFVRDAWLNKAPDDYGVVELNGETRQLWADGHLIDSIWQVIITLYVKGDADTWPMAVQTKLEELEDAGVCDLTHTISREFDQAIGKVRWTWTVALYGALTAVGEADG
jgi:hypothetical protein